MEIEKKRLGAGAALLFLSPALIGALSGCNRNCDNDRSTRSTADDCGTGRRGGSGNGYVRGGGGSFGGEADAPHRGGFGNSGRSFSGGG